MVKWTVCQEKNRNELGAEVVSQPQICEVSKPPNNRKKTLRNHRNKSRKLRS